MAWTYGNTPIGGPKVVVTRWFLCKLKIDHNPRR